MSEQNIPIAYHYDKYGVYDKEVPRQKSPREDGVYLVPGNSTITPPPRCIPPYVAHWNGTSWEQVEDHRRHLDDTGTPAGGTPYWLPAEGDDYRSEPRYMKELGPLPEGAVTTKPEKPESVIQQEQLEAQLAEDKEELEQVNATLFDRMVDSVFPTGVSMLTDSVPTTQELLTQRAELKASIDSLENQIATLKSA